ncbi:hypothetical protein SAMN05446037_1007100 [Anaerovirgula multivorans]|uniref:Histidine kinase n=1 Tax=Anaerovirgula multivorans TaxID=312168 RepID=A0A239DDS0_9FIRM|nr:HAMP domain-containing histidine kinase [Anaerovirgula multivorans]SNS29853.1 hypothetical protein SAMN05446037_1007100 [Anaerovirgula multivorans]
MNDVLRSHHINFDQNLMGSTNQHLDFMLEIEGRIEEGKLKCYINHINSHYVNYLKVEKSKIIGSSIDNIKDDFTNIYYKIINYFLENSTEDSMNIYMKKDDENFEIANLEDIKDEKCQLWQIKAYAFSRDIDFLKAFISVKDINKELYSVKEKCSVKDMKSYTDKIMNLSDIVSNLSHAWRQPLNSLNFSIINLMDEIDSETKNCRLMEEYYREIWQIIKNLSSEIEKFNTFFEMDYKKENFDIKKYLDLVFEILEEKIKREHITVDVITKEKISQYGSPNEFIQIMYCIFFDIIEHCKDELDIDNRKLMIQISTNNKKVFFDIKINYNADKYKEYKLYLNHLSMFSNIIHKRMEGTIDLINKGTENRLIIGFPLDI